MAQELALDKLKVCFCIIFHQVCPLLGLSLSVALIVCRACALSCVRSSEELSWSSWNSHQSPLWIWLCICKKNYRGFLEDYVFPGRLMRLREFMTRVLTPLHAKQTVYFLLFKIRFKSQSLLISIILCMLSSVIDKIFYYPANSATTGMSTVGITWMN